MNLGIATICMLIPILLLSIVSFAIIIERTLFFYNETKTKQRQFAQLKNFLLDKQVQCAAEFCQTNSSSFLKIVSVLFLHHDMGFEFCTNKMRAVALVETNKIKGGVKTLGTIAHVAPLLGLLGTVTGNIKAFGLLGEGIQDYSKLALAIGEALYTTAFGMVVAIFAIIFYNYFVSRIERFMVTIESDIEELRYLLATLQG